MWSLVPLPLWNPACTSGSFQFSYCWSLACRIFEHYLASMWNECSCTVVWTFFGIALLWDWNENWPFPVLWPLLSFLNLLACWVQHFHSIVFKICNSSTGIPSPLLALFTVMLPKAHLTTHSRMSGSRWVTTLSWLSWSWRSFLYSSSVYSCHLLISSASVRSIPFLSFIEHIFAWNVPLVSLIFLKRSLVFSILFFLSISLHWSLRKSFLSLLAILWNSTFKWVHLSFMPLLFTSLLSHLFVRPPHTATLLFCTSFPWGWPDPCLLNNVTNFSP